MSRLDETDRLTEGMTNGDVMQAIFGNNTQITVFENAMFEGEYREYIAFTKDWWTSPYKPQEGVKE